MSQKYKISFFVPDEESSVLEFVVDNLTNLEPVKSWLFDRVLNNQLELEIASEIVKLCPLIQMHADLIRVVFHNGPTVTISDYHEEK